MDKVKKMSLADFFGEDHEFMRKINSLKNLPVEDIPLWQW